MTLRYKVSIVWDIGLSTVSTIRRFPWTEDMIFGDPVIHDLRGIV